MKEKFACNNLLVGKTHYTQIKRELNSTTDHEIQSLNDPLNKNPTELNNLMESEHNVRKQEVKDEPMSCKELENDHILHDDLYIHEEREKVINFNVKEEIKDEPISYKELDSDSVDSINIENSDLNDVSDVILIDKDNVKHEKREKIRNYNVKVEEISDEPMPCKELDNDYILHDDLCVIYVIHEERERERVSSFNVDIHTEEIKTEEADDKESAGAAPAEKCKETHAGKIQDGSTLTPGTKNILEKKRTRSTVVEDATSRNNTKSSQQRTISRKQRLNRTGVVDEQTGTHRGKKLFECEICKLTFTRKGNLKNHSRIHTGEKPYECEICKGRLSDKSSFRRHLIIHTGEKPYECEICKVRFTRKGSLNKHLKIHTGEKPYECDLCEGRFNRKDVLKLHLKRHTGEKPYQCKICKVRFSAKRSLDNHTRIHTNEKSCKCEICNI